MKTSILDRILLLLTSLLAAWQIAVGIDQLSTLSIVAYTVGFGVLLVASLLLLILGLEVLDSPLVVIASTIIPLSLSLGLVWDHLPATRTIYLVFSVAGFLAIVITRSITMKNRLPVILLACIHGVAGMIIFLLPIIEALAGTSRPAFALVGLGGALIGVGGLLLSFLKTGKPILPRNTILKLLPGLLFLTTATFVLGLSAA